MSAEGDPSTSTTLLGKLRHDSADRQSWQAFVSRYGSRLYGWCRHWGLQDADAQDVTQQVLVKLLDKLKGFVHRGTGSFRAWLRTIAHGAYCDCLADSGRAGGSGDSGVLQRLQAIEAREDLLKRMEEEFDCELLEVAMARVRLRVQPHTWEAFRLLALEQLSGAEAAERLQMQVGAVFVAKSKVQRMLQEEVERLDVVEVP